MQINIPLLRGNFCPYRDCIFSPMDNVRAELEANARLKLERVLLHEIEAWEEKIARGKFHETDVLWLEVMREERDRRWSGPFR